LKDLKEKLIQKVSMKGYEQKVPETVRAENDEKLKAYDIEVSENEKSIQDLAKLI
jgi:hypothetical protein